MAFEGVPRETRKTFQDGTTVFERVLPGPDRMYPDTDSAPIPLDKEYIENKRKDLPEEVINQYEQLKQWEIPEDTYNYIFRNNLFPLIKKITQNLHINPKFVGTVIGHNLKYVEGHYKKDEKFKYDKIYDLFEFIKTKELEPQIVKKMLPYVYKGYEFNNEQLLDVLSFKKESFQNLLKKVPELSKKYDTIKISSDNDTNKKVDWIMGQLHHEAVGNVSLKELRNNVEKNLGKPKT
jgi:glutamyl-tRNA(Gln) amidotransferase subunit E